MLAALLIAGAVASLSVSAAAAELRVIAVDTNLADIAKQVAGDRASVESLARPSDDPHHVVARPSMIVKLSRADVFARIGMGLDMWADALLDRAGNASVQPDGKGYADCSRGLRALDVPTGRIDPSMGDLHPEGNPHYLLDPAQGILAAGNIAAALIRVDPAGQAYYHSRFLQFGERVKAGLQRWSTALKGLPSRDVVPFHKSWAYFLARFGLREFGVLEPKPGVEPSPGHVGALGQSIKRAGVKVILCESFRSKRWPDLLAGQCGATAAFVPVAVGADPQAGDYVAMFDTIVQRLVSAAR
jgi:zinc/manganese transport system substrate-binding protein